MFEGLNVAESPGRGRRRRRQRGRWLHQAGFIGLGMEDSSWIVDGATRTALRTAIRAHERSAGHGFSVGGFDSSVPSGCSGFFPWLFSHVAAGLHRCDSCTVRGLQ